jgi:hypothetical protein
MYSTQLSEPLAESESDIDTYTLEIIQAAQVVLSQERFELRYMIFPLFIAGFASKDVTRKSLALTLLQTIVQLSRCGDTTAVTLLKIVYEKQAAAVIRTGSAESVDWVGEMEGAGMQLIVYG